MHSREAELRANFAAAAKAAEMQLRTDASAAGYLELYECGLITAGEVVDHVWTELAKDSVQRIAVLSQLQNHTDASVRSWANHFITNILPPSNGVQSQP